MKILFYRKNDKNPSYKFYSQLLGVLDLDRSYSIEEFSNFENLKSQQYDILLMMGAEYKSEIVDQVKLKIPKIHVGIIDPRPSMCSHLSGFDFIIANGLESEDFYYQFVQKVFIYYTYPFFEEQFSLKKKNKGDAFVIGYHGNKIHLESMVPRITDAINSLSSSQKVIFKCIYNIEQLGRSKKIDRALKCEVQHLQYRENVYTELLDCNVGIMPQLIPIKRKMWVHMIGSTLLRINNEEISDYLLRFKPTTNIGRLLVFAQLGIPVIADLTPSSAAVIENGSTGYVAHHTSAWLHAFKSFFEIENASNLMGENLLKLFQDKFHPKVQNANLLNFLRGLSYEG